MPRQQPEQGVRDTARYRFRRSIGPCRGMDDSHDPSTLPNENVVELINGRVHDGIVVCRGGQTPVLDSGMTGCVYGMVECLSGYPRMYLHLVPLLADLYTFNPEAAVHLVNCTNEDEIVNVLPYLGTKIMLSARFCFAHFNGSVVASVIKYFPETTDAFYTISKLIPPEEGSTSTNIRAEALAVLTVKDPITAMKISMGTPSSFAVLAGAGVEQSEMLYIGTAEGGVILFNPSDNTLTQIASSGTFSSRVILFEFHGSIFAASRDKISRLEGRASGADPSGTGWTDVALPGGVASFSPTGFAVLGDTAYISGFGDSDMLALTEDTGMNMTLVSHDLIGIADPVEGGVTDVCVYEDNLYYTHNGSEYGVYVGQYDSLADTWTNRFATIVGNTRTGIANRLYTAGGWLFLLASGDTPGYNFSLYVMDKDTFVFTVLQNVDPDGYDTIIGYDMVAY